MAPKKKGGKKQADDWEADLGETIDPIAKATEDAKKAEAEQDAADEMSGGGLLAALRKNKDKRAKKGKPVINDFVEGEDPDSVAPTPPATDLEAKAPAEATFDGDDGDDVFAGPAKKGKGGKKQPDPTPVDDQDGDEADGGGVKSKKEKEREKKEREKQRKKEQVNAHIYHPFDL